MREQETDIKLETTAERHIGKSICVVDQRDFNHLDLVIEAKNNRLRAEFFYIYDYEKFNNCSLLKQNFNIFKDENGMTHSAARIVVHYLTKELKKRYGATGKGETKSKHKLTEIFKPSLNQFNDNDILIANNFIKEMFPFEGCSYTGSKLEAIIQPAKFLTLMLALRIIWSLLPGAIIPWKSFKDFMKNEETADQSKNYQSFYDNLPKFLPSYNYSCILFEFLEIFLTIFKNDYFLDLNSSIDLIFSAGQICFNRDEYNPDQDSGTDDLSVLHRFYYKRGKSFYTIFVAYLRSLSKEASAVEFKTLFDVFKIDQYPPAEHKPLSQKALTLTIPNDDEQLSSGNVNYFKLISNASNSTSRVYSSNHSFTKFENKFLDKFEANPYKIIENFFSKSSKNYLLKFDKTLNFDDFKINDEISDMRSNLKNNPGLFENKEFVSTFINEFSRYGFESGNQARNNNSDTFLNDTINFNFSSNLEAVDKLPVRVSKLEITEWFINSWKYETFLGFLTNTVVVKLTKTIGDCDWLIITCNNKISTKNRYLTPDLDIDSQKERELGGSLQDAEESKSKGISRSPKKRQSRSPKKRKSPRSKDLKKISSPSQLNNISDFEKELAKANGINSCDSNSLPSNTGKNSLNKLKPLPAPIMPNQRITTPASQITGGFPSDFDTPSNKNEDRFLPPPLLKNSVHDNSLVSEFDGLNLDDHTELRAIVGGFDKPAEDSKQHSRQGSSLYSDAHALAATVAASGLQTPFVHEVDTQKKKGSSHPYHDLKNSPAPSGLENDKEPEKESDELKQVNEKEEEEEEEEEEGEIKEQILEVPHPVLCEVVSPSPSTISTHNAFEIRDEFTDFPECRQSGTSLTGIGNSSTLERQSPAETNGSEQQSNEGRFPPNVRGTTSLFATPPASATESFPSNPPFGSSKARRFSKINLSSVNIGSSSKIIKSTVQSATSPISQSFPKFSFFAGAKKEKELRKIASSGSSNSLAFINDDSTLDNSAVKFTDPNGNRRLSIINPTEIPEIPKASRSRESSSSFIHSHSKSELLNTLTSNHSWNDMIDQNRGNFISHSSQSSQDDANSSDIDSTSEGEMDTDLTEDASPKDDLKNNLKTPNVDIDGLLEQIEETISGSDEPLEGHEK